jgi:hypothetical protein
MIPAEVGVLDPFAGAFCGAILGILAWSQGMVALRAWRIARIADGEPIVGTAGTPDGSHVDAPLSNEPAAWTRFEVRRKGSKRWYVVCDVVKSPGLTLVTADGALPIGPGARHVVAWSREQRLSRPLGPPDPASERLLEAYGLHSEGTVGRLRLVGREAILRIGRPMWAYGVRGTVGGAPAVVAGPRGLLVSDRPPDVLRTALEGAFRARLGWTALFAACAMALWTIAFLEVVR